jgi:hypothetical protein
LSNYPVNQERVRLLWEEAQRIGMTRRRFLALLGISGMATVLAACQPGLTKTSIPGATSTEATTTTVASTTSARPAQSSVPPVVNSKPFPGNAILGRPAADSVTLNLLSPVDTDFYLEYGKKPGKYDVHTGVATLQKDMPSEVTISALDKDARYYYRICHKVSGEADFSGGPEAAIHTQRAPGSAFTFCIQGDSHPERAPNDFNTDLYRLTLLAAESVQPDFYMTIGDDFSIDNLKTVNADTVAQLYINQRQYLQPVACYAPILLVNGNHEQAAAYLLDGTPNNPAVWAQNARNRYYPEPAPDGFYSGDAQPVQFIGPLRDYYAWTWGDALLVVIDFYWHSPVPVDNVFRGATKTRNMWDITLGDTQYQWLTQTLQQSKAKYKFVFAHHVLGTERGGIDIADQYEWGGKGKNGTWEFDKMRPGWALPIHQLMVKNGVTIFFQGHDHLFARQELDGVIYQELPQPADPMYTLYNADAYKSGVKLPNTGHLRVAVSPDQVKVDYVSSFLPKDEKEGQKNGQVAYSYTVK